MSIPYVDGYAPLANSINNVNTTTIGFNLLDAAGGLYGDTIEIYVDGTLIFSNETFVSQFSGSSYAPITVGGDDGYALSLVNSNTYPDGALTIDVVAENFTTSVNIRWSILIGTTHNAIYYADGYGIKKLKMSEAIGECYSLVRVLFPAFDEVTYLQSETVDNYYYLAVSTPTGALVIKNEAEPSVYMDGYSVSKAQLNSRGILYAINEGLNQVEVYYGASFRTGNRVPDFVYNSVSTPAIMGGTINDIHIVNEASAKLPASSWTRLYVGTSLGMTRIETYDRENPTGYCDGYDSGGIAINYSISSGSGTYKIIGGTIPNVTRITSTETEGIVYVVTNDGAGNGGVSQLSLYQNKRIIFMTKENGLLPSNDVRDIVG